MVSQVVSFFRVLSRNSDWTQEEIAELYRIENALVQARLSVQTDRGVTDEGDPWFVFCRSDGEVLVHISRFDGGYRLYTAALNKPLTGQSLMSLSKSFVSQIPLQTPLRPSVGASVYVHPAAMLAVIIGTIFYSWDDLLRASQTEIQEKQDGDLEDRNAAKVSHQSMIMSYIEGFLTQRGEAPSHQDTSYFNFISTVAALMVGVGIASIVGPIQEAVAVVETTATAKSPETPEITLVAKNADGAVHSYKIMADSAGILAREFAFNLQQPEQRDVPTSIGHKADTAPTTPAQGDVAFAKDVPELMGSTGPAADDGSAARSKMAATDFNGAIGLSAYGMAVAAQSSNGAEHTQTAPASQGGGLTAHASNTLGGEGAVNVGGDWLNLPLKLISEVFGSSTNVKTIVSVDAMSAPLSNIVSQGLSILDNGHAFEFLKLHPFDLGLKVASEQTVNLVDSGVVQKASITEPVKTVETPAPAWNSTVGVVSSLGQSFALLSSDSFAHLLASFVKAVSDVEVMVVNDSFIFASVAFFEKLDPGSVSLNLQFHDGSSISVVGQAASLLHIIEAI